MITSLIPVLNAVLEKSVKDVAGSAFFIFITLALLYYVFKMFAWLFENGVELFMPVPSIYVPINDGKFIFEKVQIFFKNNKSCLC